jgi:competence protein ComEC
MNYNSYIWIFNVGRGLSILILSPFKYGILVDLGSSDEFSPINYIKEKILPKMSKYDGFDLAQVLITHPHADHISDIQNLDKLGYKLITCPHNKSDDEKFDFSVLESHKNLEKYLQLIEKRNLPLQTIHYTSRYSSPTQSEYGLYYIKPPIVRRNIYNDDFKYTNGSSIVLYYRYGENSILIPGDILPESFEYLLDEKFGCEKRFSLFSYMQSNNTWNTVTSNQPSLKSLLKNHGLSILVAPHHGLESAYSDKLYESIKDGKPSLVMISEKRHNGQNDGKVDGRYQSSTGAKGHDAVINGKLIKDNYSLSTRNSCHYLITFSPVGKMQINGDSNIDNLINLI